MSGHVVVRDELREAGDLIVEVADAWKRAYDARQRAVKRRDRVTGRMDRQVMCASGGLGVARGQALCRRRSFHTGQGRQAGGPGDPSQARCRGRRSGTGPAARW